MMVPVMAVLYMVVVLLLIILNFTRIPYFFGSVFAGAFKPDAFLGGVFGTVLAQGVKRGLMSNEAGQERSPCQRQQLTQSIHVSRA